jgi:hypothetical protein
LSGGSNTISACASKRTGVLRVPRRSKHCKRSERAITWNKVGPTGPRGAPGAPGTVDTSNFYTKSDSDSRYLPLHGTADNANQLGGQPASSYVANGYFGQETLRFLSADVPAGSSSQLYPAVPLGSLTGSCDSPPSDSTLQYAFSGTTGHIQRTYGTTTTYGTSDTPLNVVAAGYQVQYLIDYADGTVAKLDVWAANGPDGMNLCRFRVFATIVAPG